MVQVKGQHNSRKQMILYLKVSQKFCFLVDVLILNTGSESEHINNIKDVYKMKFHQFAYQRTKMSFCYK